MTSSAAPADSTPRADAGALPAARISTGLFIAGALAIVIAMTYVHVRAGLTLPVPWGDEAFFVWQARAFQNLNSFSSPEMHEGRPILLLPFVYPGVLGAMFKVTGYSFALARWFSFGSVLAGFGMLAWLVRRQHAAVVALFVIGMFMMNAHMVAMGNTARMEAFFFATLCASLLLMEAGEAWLSLALLSLTPMIHPNGMIFLLPAAIFLVVTGRLRRTKFTRGALVLLIVSALAWLANGLYALSYWEGFKHDFALRLGESALHTGFDLNRTQVLWLAGLVSTVLVALWRRASVGPMLVFAIGAWLATRIRTEQWYEAICDWSYLLIGLSIMRMVADAFADQRRREEAQRPVSMAPGRPAMAAGVAGILFLAACHATAIVPGPRHYLSDLQVNDMRVAGPVRYFEDADRQAVLDMIHSVSPDSRVLVELYPWGDALLLGELDHRRMQFQVPYFDVLFQPAETWIRGYQPDTAVVPDLFIVRASRYHPRWLAYRQDKVFERALALAGADSATVFHSRDSTEVWYAIKPTQRSR